MLSGIRPLVAGVVALACALTLASLAAAMPPPQPEWEVEIAPYGWFSLAHGKVETPLGTEEFTVDAHDLIDSIDLGAMGAVKLRWKRWVALFDVDWAKLSTKDGVGNSLVDFKLTEKIGFFEALAGYRVYEKPGGLFGADCDRTEPRSVGREILRLLVSRRGGRPRTSPMFPGQRSR